MIKKILVISARKRSQIKCPLVKSTGVGNFTISSVNALFLPQKRVSELTVTRYKEVSLFTENFFQGNEQGFCFTIGSQNESRNIFLVKKSSTVVPDC